MILNPYVFGAAATWSDLRRLTTEISDSTGYSGYTIRCVYDPGATKNATKVRISFKSANSGGVVMGEAYVGKQAASGDAYDFATTPTPITWNGGSTTCTIPANTSQQSDEVNFAITSGDKLVFSFYFSGASSLRIFQDPGTSDICRYKLGNDAATVDATGYTPDTLMESLNLVEIYG